MKISLFKKKQYLSEKKIRAEGFTWKKNSCTSSERKKKIVQGENSPPAPITFLMVRPLSLENNKFLSRLSMIVRVNVVLNRTVVVDNDWSLDNLR